MELYDTKLIGRLKTMVWTGFLLYIYMNETRFINNILK